MSIPQGRSQDKGHPALPPWAGAGAELGQGGKGTDTDLDPEQSLSQQFDPNLLRSCRKLAGMSSSPSFPGRVIQVKLGRRGVNDPGISAKSY